jgi:hypothetical protein
MRRRARSQERFYAQVTANPSAATTRENLIST